MKYIAASAKLLGEYLIMPIVRKRVVLLRTLAFRLSGVSRVRLSSYSASLRSFAPVSPFIQTKTGFSPHLLSEELTAILSKFYLAGALLS